jgi:hypothetical protein
MVSVLYRRIKNILKVKLFNYGLASNLLGDCSNNFSDYSKTF